MLENVRDKENKKMYIVLEWGTEEFENRWDRNGGKELYVSLLQTANCTTFPERNISGAKERDAERVLQKHKQAAKMIEQIVLQVAIGLQELHQSY